MDEQTRSSSSVVGDDFQSDGPTGIGSGLLNEDCSAYISEDFKSKTADETDWNNHCATPA